MRNKFISHSVLAILSFAFFSCASSKAVKNQDAWPEFYTENPPVSVLVMPPINQTNNVDAKDYFYYTLQTAMSNRGYYVFPPLLSYETLQQESAYDSELFIESDITAFRRTFGADLLLFTRITNWKKHPVGGKVDVEIEYILRSASTGNTVYSRKMNCVCDTSFKSGLANSGGIFALVGVIVDAIGTAVKTGVTDYTIVARGCNQFGIDVPAGKYNPYFGKDYDTLAGSNPGNVMIQSNWVTDNALFTPATLTSLQAKEALVPSALAASASSTSSSSGTSAASSQQAAGPSSVPENSSVHAMLSEASSDSSASGALVPGAKVTLTARGVGKAKVLFTGSFVEGQNFKKGVLGERVDDTTVSAVVTVPASGSFSWKTVHFMGAAPKNGIVTFANLPWLQFGWEKIDRHTDKELEVFSPIFER